MKGICSGGWGGKDESGKGKEGRRPGCWVRECDGLADGVSMGLSKRMLVSELVWS